MVLNLRVVAPEITVLACALLLLVLDLFVPERRKNGIFAVLSSASMVLSGILAVSIFSTSTLGAFNGFVQKDALVGIVQIFILLCGIMASLLSYSYIKKFSLRHKGEYYYTLLFAVFGALLLVASAELTTLFVSLEVMSISVYILIALFKKAVREEEAGLKYFIMGSVGAGLLVYGLAVLYSVTGTTVYKGVSDTVRSLGVTPGLLLSLVLIAVAFLFKTGAVPFHGWVPDVYHGSPTPVTTFMGAVVKMSAFIAFLRLFLPVFSSVEREWASPVLFVAIVTMLAGAFMALNQRNIKRMLAYSAVSHTGAILSAFATSPALASFTVLFYLVVYVFMTVSAFGLVSLLTRGGFKGEDLDDWKGLYSENAFVSACAVVVFMSLAGIPPFAGFWAKFYLLLALVKSGFIATALVLVLSSAISLYFYLKPIVYIFMKENAPSVPKIDPADYVVVGFSTLSIVVLGIFPKIVSGLSLLGTASFVRGIF